MKGENPALWKGGLEAVLKPITRKNVKHHAAMHYDDIPTFMVALKASDAIAARALELTILTASRTSEVLKATSDEFDLNAGQWVLSADRMKSGRPQTVPLSLRADEIVREMRCASTSPFIFPGQNPARPLSNMAMTMLLRRMNQNDITVHGFRSTFRDWAGDCSAFPREVAEAALSHSVGDAVERSYRRKNALEKRRLLMQAWSDYCSGTNSADVVLLYG